MTIAQLGSASQAAAYNSSAAFQQAVATSDEDYVSAGTGNNQSPASQRTFTTPYTTAPRVSTRPFYFTDLPPAMAAQVEAYALDFQTHNPGEGSYGRTMDAARNYAKQLFEGGATNAAATTTTTPAVPADNSGKKLAVAGGLVAGLFFVAWAFSHKR